jgi:histone deacetylase complex subunit SAP18
MELSVAYDKQKHFTLHHHNTTMALQPTPDQKIDRQTTTPFLLRLYYRSNGFHSPNEFSTVPPPSSLQQSSLQIYTWPSCTLSELTSLLTTALPSLLPSPSVGTRIGYRLVFPDTRSVPPSGGSDAPGRWLSKELGSVILGQGDDYDQEGDPAGLGRMHGDAQKSLADARFVIGDYISCAIFPPLADGSVAPLPPATPAIRGTAGRGGPPPRGDNGRPPASGRGQFAGDRAFGQQRVPHGEWRRGERVPEYARSGRGGGGGERERGGGRNRPY